MSKVRTNDGYKDIEAVYAGNIPIDAIYDKNGNILFSAYNEVNGISPLSFKSKTNNNSILKNYRIYGNTVSDESVGDKTNNLFDGNFLQGYWAYADGSFVNTNTWICTNKIPCTEGQVYTYSFAKTSRQTGFVWYDANGDYISSSNAQDYSSTPYRLYSATAPIDAAFMIVNIAGYPESPNAIAPSDITDFMLVKGQYTSNTMPSYEPYGYRIPVTVTNGTDTETTTLYLPEQIKMVGDEAEYIDFKEQKQHRVRKNLLQNTGTSRTINGVTFTVNSDGSVTCNTDENGATATAIFNVYAQNFTLASDNYILSGCPIGGDISTKYKLDAQVFTDGFESWISDIGDGANIYSDKIITILLMRIVIYKNQVCDNLTFYPMIRKADISDDTYEPYITNTELNVTLPSISVPSGINILSVETGIQPSDIYLKGKIEKKPKIYYYSDDRQTLLYTESVLKGENGTYSSPPEKTNYTFLGWQPRAININKNENCYAVFVEQNENEAILVMYAINGLYNNKNAIDFVFKHSVPADKYDIVKVGIHYGTNKLAGANTTINGYDKVDLTVNGAAYGVNDVETVLRTGGGKLKNLVATYTSHNGKLALSYALGNNVDSYALAVGYIQAIEKATGNEVTFYSNLISTTYNKCSQLYTVTFYNDATLLKTGKAAYGDNIIYSGATPTKASTQQYEYNFLGWNTDSSASTADANALANITSNKTVYAIFAQTVKRYTITFCKGQSAIGIGMVNYGDNAMYSGETPTKASTQQYNYNFLGWSTDPSATIADANALSNITADRTVYAIFAQTTRTYTVTFYNESTVLETVYNVPYGGTATYTGSTPIKTDYTFTGWLPQPTNITADTSCYAQFEEASAYITDSWETISQRSAAGAAANYYSVGDCKPIELNGTMGTLTLDHETVYVYILGFNHNSTYEPNGITFGGFKTAPTDGKDICLIDSHYNSNNTTGLKWFNMNHRKGNSEHCHNYGGWKSCDMRYDILGSTDTAPSGYGAQATTSNVGYDASSTCATSPVANTLMSCLPSDLRAVMKPMTKYTNNVGNRSNTSENVTASIDYLPLLAEYEIFGARSYANQYEQNKQAQYAYYADGNNSKVKYMHSSTGSTAYWWERSPYYNDSNSFCYVGSNGSANGNYAKGSYGVAPIFLVGTPDS